MKVRIKNSSERMNIYANEFATCDSTLVIGHDELGLSNANIFKVRDLEVWIEALQEWKNMYSALIDCDLIVDDHNIHFFEPINEEQKQRFIQ